MNFKNDNILIKYNYFPSLTGKLRTVDIYIYENFEFELNIFWHGKPDGRLFGEEYNRSSRRNRILKDKLPEKIKNKIEKLLSFERFEIKRTYPELTEKEKQQYEPNDIGNEFYTFYISGKKCSVNVNPWYFKRELLKTEQELVFLEFHKNILDWIDETHNKLIAEED